MYIIPWHTVCKGLLIAVFQMSCQDKVARQWKWDSGHLSCAGRNDRGMVFCIKSMHISNYKRKGEVCCFSFFHKTCLLTALVRLALSLWLQPPPESTFLPRPLPLKSITACSFSSNQGPRTKFSLFPHFYCSFSLSCHNRITSHPFPTQYLGASLLIPLS